MVLSLASVFSPVLLSGSSGIAVSCNVQFPQYVQFLISACGVFSFFVSYVGLRCLCLRAS